MFGQNVEKYVRQVGHDRIDAGGEELFHLCGVVDRPHVDLNPVMVRRLDEPWRDHVHSAEGRRDLKRVEWKHRVPPRTCEHASPKPERALAARRGRHSPSAVLAKGFRHVVMLRSNEHPVVNAVVFDEVPKPPREARIVRFDLQVVVEPWVERESFLERRNTNARASKRVAPVFDEVVTGVEALELGKGVVAKVTLPIGRAFEREVVKTHEVTIRGFVDVGLEVPVAELRRVAKREERVFRSALRASAVRKGDWCRRAEVGASHRASSIALFTAVGG